VTPGIGAAIRAVAPLLSKVAADLRGSRDAARLGQLLRLRRITDADDLDTLAKLVTGRLNRG